MPEAASAASLLPAEIRDASTGTQICVCSTGEMVHFFMSKLVKLYTSIAQSFSFTGKGRSHVDWFFKMVPTLIFPNTIEKRGHTAQSVLSCEPPGEAAFWTSFIQMA